MSYVLVRISAMEVSNRINYKEDNKLSSLTSACCVRLLLLLRGYENQINISYYKLFVLGKSLTSQGQRVQMKSACVMLGNIKVLVTISTWDRPSSNT